MPDKHKVHFCIYCKKEVKRIQQHFVRQHKNEEKIKEIVAIQDKKKKFWEWKLIKQLGDDYFNKKASDKPGAKIITRRATPYQLNRRYYTCKNCFGRLRTTSRYKHEIKCSAQIQGLNEEKEPGDFLDRFPEDLVLRVRQSPHLNNFFQNLFQQNGREDRRVLRTAITDLIDLETEIRLLTEEPNKFLVNYFTPGDVDNVIWTIKIMGGDRREGKNRIFRNPWKVQRLCRWVTKLAKYVISTNYKRNADSVATGQSKFLELFEEESNKFVRKQANRTIRLKEQQKKPKLPLTSHIMKVTKYLEEETPRLIQCLEDSKSEKDWRKLAENLLCKLTIFNRRRGGAVEKLTVEQFTSRTLTQESLTEEALFNLTKEESEFLENVKIIDISHKCDNLVPIYITHDVEKAMSTLLDFRQHGNINPKNEYFFAASGKSLNPIRGVDVMDKYRQILPKNIRELFTATNLRKHGATTSKMLDLSSEDAENWASHMGHTLTIHKKFYRQRENVEAILKTGKLLKALHEGTLKYFKGKKLQDIPLIVNDPEKNSEDDPESSASDNVARKRRKIAEEEEEKEKEEKQEKEAKEEKEEAEEELELEEEEEELELEEEEELELEEEEELESDEEEEELELDEEEEEEEAEEKK